MWKALIAKWEPNATFENPASLEQIAAAEKALAVALPDDLRDLLLETNGVSASEYGPLLIWSVERIAADNLEFRTFADFRNLYMPFDHLLFFGDNGGGDQFAYAILNGAVRWPRIYRWCHENDAREHTASSLDGYLQRRRL